MVSVTVYYEGMGCKTFDHITKIFYGDIGGTKELPVEQIYGHHFSFESDLWLHSDNGIVFVRTSGLRCIEIQQE